MNTVTEMFIDELQARIAELETALNNAKAEGIREAVSHCERVGSIGNSAATMIAGKTDLLAYAESLEGSKDV